MTAGAYVAGCWEHVGCPTAFRARFVGWLGFLLLRIFSHFNQVRAAGGASLFENLVDMGFYCGDADVQLLGNLCIGTSHEYLGVNLGFSGLLAGAPGAKASASVSGLSCGA